MLCEICEENEASVKVQDTPYKTVDACAACAKKREDAEPTDGDPIMGMGYSSYYGGQR